MIRKTKVLFKTRIMIRNKRMYNYSLINIHRASSLTYLPMKLQIEMYWHGLKLGMKWYFHIIQKWTFSFHKLSKEATIIVESSRQQDSCNSNKIFSHSKIRKCCFCMGPQDVVKPQWREFYQSTVDIKT